MQKRDFAIVLALGAAAGLASLAVSRPRMLTLAAPLVLLALAWWALADRFRWLLAFLAAVVVLPPLPLPWGDAGPHPAMLLAGLGVLAGAARLPAWRVRLDAVSAALGFLLFAVFFSVPLAAVYSGWAVGIGSLARAGLFAIAVYVYFYLAHGPGRELEPERLVRVLFGAAVISAVIACADFYYQFPALGRFAEQFVWLSNTTVRRAQGVFYEATVLALFCVFFLVMIAAMAVLRVTRDLRLRPWWLAAAAPVLVAALIFSFSRSAIVALLVSLAALAVVERERLRSTRRFLWSVAAVAAVAVGAAGVAARAFPELFGTYVERLQYSSEALFSTPAEILAPRLESWRLLTGYIAEHPGQTLLGIGYKTLPYSQYLGRPVITDNMYLSMLVETGWMGAVALVLFNAAVLVVSYRRARAAVSRTGRFFAAWMFAFWCGQTVQMLAGDTLTYWRLLPLYFAVLAFAVRTDEYPFPGPVQ
jgi:O-antigen ligase